MDILGCCRNRLKICRHSTQKFVAKCLQVYKTCELHTIHSNKPTLSDAFCIFRPFSKAARNNMPTLYLIFIFGLSSSYACNCIHMYIYIYASAHMHVIMHLAMFVQTEYLHTYITLPKTIPAIIQIFTCFFER